jgi:hypothetical protein
VGTHCVTSTAMRLRLYIDINGGKTTQPQHLKCFAYRFHCQLTVGQQQRHPLLVLILNTGLWDMGLNLPHTQNTMPLLPLKLLAIMLSIR